MTEVKSIKLVKNGTITIEASERPELSTMGLKKLCGIGGGSSVALIESDANILVDTGYDFETNLSEENIKRNKKDLIHALKNFGLRPDDIDMFINLLNLFRRRYDNSIDIYEIESSNFHKYS